jgi:hypothetical protein
MSAAMIIGGVSQPHGVAATKTSRKPATTMANTTAKTSIPKATNPKPAAVKWLRYTNERFGYTLLYPSTLIAQPEAENGDGRVFLTADESVGLIVYGGNVVEGVTPWGGTEVGDIETYYKKFPDGWVRSGTRNNGTIIWYSRFHTDEFSTATFSISYPAKHKTFWNAAVTKMNGSFSLAN